MLAVQIHIQHRMRAIWIQNFIEALSAGNVMADAKALLQREQNWLRVHTDGWVSELVDMNSGKEGQGRKYASTQLKREKSGSWESNHLKYVNKVGEQATAQTNVGEEDNHQYTRVSSELILRTHFIYSRPTNGNDVAWGRFRDRELIQPKHHESICKLHWGGLNVQWQAVRPIIKMIYASIQL